jgi:hypothetical protein
MAIVNTINFLPRIFRTPTNRRFLGATMDHLASDSINTPINGYIGRTFAPTYKPGDNYVPESTDLRKNYQLEPSAVVTDTDGNIVFNTGYIDLLQNIKNYGGITDNQQRLFGSEMYNWDGHFDYDKFVNYYNYYWLPNGPDAISIYGNQAPYTADYTVVRNSAVGGYTFTGKGYQPNTQLTLVRGGVYTFTINQPGHDFWIQRSPGVNGIDPNIPTVSTRDVFGVTNNGASDGTVTFRVPLYNAQDFYILMPIKSSVDAATTLKYTDVQNRLLSDFLIQYPDGIDGINNQLQNKTLIFIGNDEDDTYWTTPTVDPLYTSLDVASIRPGDVIADAVRVSTWKINLVAVDSAATDYIIQLSPENAILTREKVFISSGKTYASQKFWLNDNLSYNVEPAITANTDRLYYQDSSNPGFVGEIRIINNTTDTIEVDTEIIGQVGYTSPNGVVFTNGLKIQFDSLVTPASYYKFDYVNYATWLTALNAMEATVTGTSGGAVAYRDEQLVGEWNGTTGYRIREWYVEGVGTAINLVPVGQTTVPEAYGYLLDTTPDYITINRGSRDRNPWARSNRWFHKDVIAATAEYNNATENYGPNLPGRRPIIEFDPDLQLFNFGQQAKNSVDLVTFEETDAFGITIPATRVEGQTTAVVDGITLAPGHRVVFANDYDLNVKNKIWEVTVIEGLAGQNYINLISVDDNPVLAGENVLVTEGDNAGKTYYFDGADWFVSQSKSGINQMPVFDLVDAAGYSFSDTTVYPGSTFAGNRIFNYNVGTGNNDIILGFPLSYQNFNNIGDIVFKNYYNTDSFTYTSDTNTGATQAIACSTGYLIKNTNLTTQEKLNSWVPGAEDSSQYQLFTKFFDGRVIDINGVNRAFVQVDVLPSATDTIPHLKVYKNNMLLTGDVDYELTTYGMYNIIIFLSDPVVGDKLDVAIFSHTASKLAPYEVPKNLIQNPLNENFSTIALGQIRTHYNKLLENTAVSNRPIQDTYLKQQNGTLNQHSAPLVYAMTFLNDPMLNFVNGIDLAKKEYSRFKNKFISLCSTLSGLNYNDPVTGVDAILQNINAVKNSSFPWYYSDMVPQGGNYTTITYTVLNVRQTNYEIGNIFNPTELSNRAVLIWHNGTQLVLGRDYTFSDTVPAVIFSIPFAIDDTIVIRDYFDTDGNFIPETPSKLGLYPKSEPLIYQDITYQTPVDVIRGHDGSVMPAFGDFRDDYILELEKRIYNNIKADYTKNIINLYDIVPGRFRTTEYTRDEFVQILSRNFLQWSGTNNVDYTTNNWYDANNSWTWNYEKFTDTLDDKPLQGSWRAIFNYWYDTDQPNTAPWEMLGFGFKPAWWETRYGPAPYTRGNFTLWEDLEAGYVWNNGDSYTDARFARPGLTQVIPVDTAGNLLPPTDINIVKQYNLTAGGNNYVIGQEGPVETAWIRSSDYPFAVQMAIAMAKPASYFGTQYDTSRFYVSDITGQFSSATNEKINPADLKINGDSRTGTVQRTSGYINWIADVIKNVGIDPVEKISSYLENLSVKLNYKVGGFTDKNILTVTAEQTTPGAKRAGVIIPDSNYEVYLNKSIPVAVVAYSAVIVQRTNTGYSVVGYNTNDPFFTILPSIANSKAETVTVGDVTAKLYQDTTNRPVMVPYGTTYSNIQQLSDFLVSYERYLESVGFVFDQFDKDIQEVKNFRTSVKEFLYWSQQGWEVGTILVLNPVTNQLVLKTSGTVVDEVTNTLNSGRILDQNFLPIKSGNFNVIRLENFVDGNRFGITTLNGTGICFVSLNLVQFEHVLVFDNESDFGDIIYVPSQGVRQYRLSLSGSKTGGWTGALSASGYMYNTTNVVGWTAGTDYQVGDIVTFNNNYYTALNSIPATTKFNIADWAQIQESELKTGLLPSLGLLAQQSESIYNVDQPPDNETLQLFSAGLIGFRPRDYLTDLGLGTATQTKFYQGLIKEKGTLNSITALTKGNFDNVTGNIAIFEEWGFKVGDYGDLDGNQFKEFVLDQSVFNTNPVAFTLGNTYSAGNIIVNLQANANLTISNVYNSSNLSNTSTAIYSNRDKSFYINDLPTAGYVHVDDVDLTIFNINEYNQDPDVGIGSKVWTAKDTGNNWNVYRVTETDISATTLTYVLDDYAQLLFTNKHPFQVGDLLILKGFQVAYFDNSILENFSTNYDNIYKIVDVVNDLTVTVQLKDTAALSNLIATSPVVSEAAVYKLVSSKVSTVTAIDNLLPLHGWVDNDRVWVDTATADAGWGVYTFNQAWPNTTAGNLTANTVTANDQFGSQLTISTTGKYFYSSNPGQKQVQVFANAAGNYSANVTVSNTEAKFGSVIESQGNLLAVAAAGNVRVYRHNDSTTANTMAIPWVSNAFPTLGTAWTANTIIAINTQISNGSNTYVTTGNVYGATFTVANVQANVRQVAFIPINSIISYLSNIYITTANVCPANVFLETTAEKFAAITSNVRQIDLVAGNIVLLQTITTANMSGNISSVSISSDMKQIYIGGNNRVEAYTTTNGAWANVKYTWANAVTGVGAFGNVVKTVGNGSRLLIGASTATNTYDQNGNVYYYTVDLLTNAIALTQTLSSDYKNQGAQFGYQIGVDNTAANVFVGAPGSLGTDNFYGIVEHWKYNGSSYTRAGNVSRPRDQSGAFGTTLAVSPDAKFVAVGSRGSASEETTVFDDSATVIDNNSTQFIDSIVASGSVYVFEPLMNLVDTTNVVYSFTQELETGRYAQLESGDNFGAAVAVAPGLLLAGAPDTDSASGVVYTFNNLTNTPSWQLTRSEQPQVDIDSINRSFIYNKSNNNLIAPLDIVDPAKGRILSGVANDIDYRLDHDPATYNAGTQDTYQDYHWGPAQVGRIWWNLDNLRYTNYEQDALIYRLNHWGNRFPGSKVEIYEWIESSVLPSEFTASGESGVPLYSDNSAYSTYGYVDQSGAVRVKYYFWVALRDQANTRAGKQNSVVAITSAIENPQNQNIPYATVLRNDTIALYNVKNLLVGKNTILHLGGQSTNAGLIHSEYALVQENSPSSQLPESIINKLVDSLCQKDASDNPVPDPALLASQRYGISIRPRQTMFIDVNAALKNLITLVNEKLYYYPITQRKVLTLLNSEESPPSSRTGQYNLTVDTKLELSYITTDTLAVGYKVLVLNDPTYLTKWAIYEWSGSAWTVPANGTRPLGNGVFGDWVQAYKTNLYWNYIDWYSADFDPTTTVNITVTDNLEFGKLTLQADTYVKVLNAGNDQFAIYYIDNNLNRVTVGLGAGTIQLSDELTMTSDMATEFHKELRQILLSIKNELFIDDLAGDYNQIFFAMIKYALVEQKNLDWVFKTSFISATQYIRKLEQFASYISDNQDFYQSYIDEVKPYRTILREFNINYQRNDEFGGDITDFDLAPYWDSNINVYRSPSGEQSYDAGLLNNRVYYDWKNNYAYGVVDILVGAGGSGYVTAPQIIISGGGGTGANAVAQINGLGELANITVVSAGTGYTSSPTIIINGTGTNAVATAVLRNVFDGNDTGHNVVRSIKTNIKFDRLTYDIKRPAEWANTIAESTGLTNTNAAVMWDEVTAGQVIAANTVINLGGELYQLSIFPHTVSANVDFPLANVSSINAGILPTANDRIVAYNGNIDLSASTEGMDYPGVIVDGSTYFAYDTVAEWTANTDIVADTQISYSGNIYIVTGNVYAGYFANIVANVTQVSGEKIDAIIQSRFADNLGLDSGNIYVDGGEYVDRFSSHAPEELVPGHMFDSLNLKVFSNTAPATNDYAFRLFDNMSEDHTFYRISDAYTTTLSRDLLISDDKIFVTDGTRLPNPNRDAGIPGVIFVNGEKISYYRNYAQETITAWTANATAIPTDTLTSFNGNVYLTLGNVYAPNTPWTANTTFAANSYVYFSGNSYRITGNVNAPYFANISANTVLIYGNENSGFATISSNVALIANTSSVLGQIRRATDGTAPNRLNTVSWFANLVVPTGSYIVYGGNTFVTTGNVYGFDILWRPNVALAANTYFTYIGNVYQVSSNVGANVYGSSFANVSANANVKYTGRTDSGYASIESNVRLLYRGTNSLRHLANTRVVDSSEQQTIPDITVSNTSIVATTAVNTTSNVTLKLRLNGNITANIGDYILTNIANLRLLETVTTASNIAVLPHTGNIFVGNANAISIVSRITGNATSTTATVIYANVLGQVSSVGNVTVLANTYVTQSSIWYGNVTNTFYGDTLNNSTTAQATFLKASPGYTP